jgi:FMN reductase
MRSVIVVGNPKPRSRTYAAAQLVVEQLSGRVPDAEIDLVDLGAGLLDWADPAVAEAQDLVRGSDLAVVASPTYKGTYTGLLKLFLDRFGAGELHGVTGVPLLLGADTRHALAAELTLKPVLVEIGLTCPTSGLFLVDRESGDPAALEPWLLRGRAQIGATLGALR